MASGSSLSDVPLVETNPSPRARASASYRQSLAESARAEGDNNILWVSATSMWSSINKRYSEGQASGEAFEIDLHDLWFTYYQAAMNVSSASANQDRLAFQIVQAREQGVLLRHDSVERSTEPASTVEGIIWTDLPFLVPDMTGFWIQGCASMSGAQRVNFASFLAKLASVSLANDKLCGIALIVMRETLETKRSLGRLNEFDGEDTSRTIGEFSIASLLPTANTWLFNAGVKLVQLSDILWNDCPVDVGRTGDLLQQDSVVNAVGFSPQRWIYWLRRLEWVIEEATQAQDHGLAEYASRMLDNMLIVVDERHSRVNEELATAGGARLQRPMMQQLGQGLH